MTHISSETNPKLKYVRRLQSDRKFRQKEGVFVVEGTRWVAELVQSAVVPALFFATAAWLADPAHQQLVAQWGHTPLVVEAPLLHKMAETETPSGVLVVIPQPQLAWPTRPNLLLVLDAIRDPGNLGTILRSAAAAGVSGVVLAPGCVDVFNPKVVRSSMGTLLRLPHCRARWEEMAPFVAHTAVYLAAGEATTRYTAVDWRPPTTLIIGGEADGAGSQARHLAHTLVSIPMHNQTESLNAAVAASIILFEAVRQRGEP